MKTVYSMGLLAIGALLLSGCVVRTAANLVTLPVKAGAKAVDWTTTSQDEADRNHGREMRKKCKKNPDADYCRE